MQKRTLKSYNDSSAGAWNFQRPLSNMRDNSLRKPVKTLKGDVLLTVSSAGYFEDEREHAIFSPRVGRMFKSKDLDPWPKMVDVKQRNNDRTFFMGGCFGILKVI